jgi:hypothetical protein
MLEKQEPPLPRGKDPASITAPADAPREVEAADAEIDALVYELCGLVEEEIAIAEGRHH